MAYKQKAPITWPKLLFVIGIPLLIILSYFLISHLTTPPVVTSPSMLSATTIAKLDKMVQQDSNIIALHIMTIDIQKNTKRIVYTAVSNTALSLLYREYLTGSVSADIPVFTTDVVNNSHMVSVLNHEFICYPFKDSLSYKYLPLAAQYIKTVCTTGIPPSYGEFKGAVVLYLSTLPSTGSQDQLILIAKDLAELVDSELK